MLPARRLDSNLIEICRVDVGVLVEGPVVTADRNTTTEVTCCLGTVDPTAEVAACLVETASQ